MTNNGDGTSGITVPLQYVQVEGGSTIERVTRLENRIHDDLTRLVETSPTPVTVADATDYLINNADSYINFDSNSGQSTTTLTSGWSNEVSSEASAWEPFQPSFQSYAPVAPPFVTRMLSTPTRYDSFLRCIAPTILEYSTDEVTWSETHPADGNYFMRTNRGGTTGPTIIVSMSSPYPSTTTIPTYINPQPVFYDTAFNAARQIGKSTSFKSYVDMMYGHEVQKPSSIGLIASLVLDEAKFLEDSPEPVQPIQAAQKPEQPRQLSLF